MEIVFELQIAFNALALSHYMKDKLEKKYKFRTTKTQNLVKGYLRYKTVTSQNVSFEAQVKYFFISQKLFSARKIFKFLYFEPSHDLLNL